MKLYHTYSQPQPVPVNPVESLKVLFSSRSGLISWQPPYTGYTDGCDTDAFTSWKYSVEVVQFDNNENKHVLDNITDTRVMIEDGEVLKPNIIYDVRVLPYSLGGFGPWSTRWRGRTLSGRNTPEIVWADGRGIYSMNILGQNKTMLNSSRARALIKHKKTLYWAFGGSLVKQENSGLATKIRTESYDIFSMAIDTWGERIYYSLPSLQVIRRITLDGDLEMTIDMNLSMTHIVVSSPSGLICGIVLDSSIVCTDLRGALKKTIFNIDLWEDTKLINLAIENETVYIITHSNDKYSLHRKRVTDDRQPIELKSLSSQFIQGDLVYLNRKVFFIENKKYLVTLELDGNGVSKTDLKSLIDTFTIYKDDADTDDYFDVIPRAVTSDSINFVSVSNTTSIVWAGVDDSINSNKSRVSYTVLINIDGDEELLFKVDSPELVNISLPAHTQCNITLTSHTLWASSTMTMVQLVSPQSVPSAPNHLAVFWDMDQYKIRWRPPRYMNGELSHYVVSCILDNIDHCQHVHTNDTTVEVTLPHGVYNISVAGVTSAGIGLFSIPTTSSMQEIHLEPKIVLSIPYPPADIHLSCTTGHNNAVW